MWLDRIRHSLARRTIFISYRRTDAGGYAAQLRDELARRYRSKLLFLDHRDIEAGEPWAVRLEASLEAADVVLVIIGPDWLHVRDETGERRLDDPTDWVRREVEAALTRPKTRVIPVLVGDADAPAPKALPASIAGLAGRQARAVRPDAFATDARRLVRGVGGWRSQLAGLPTYVWPLAVIGVAALTWLAVWIMTPDQNEPPDLPESVEATTSQGVPVEIDLLAGVVDDESAVELASAGPLSEHGGRIAWSAPAPWRTRLARTSMVSTPSATASSTSTARRRMAACSWTSGSGP